MLREDIPIHARSVLRQLDPRVAPHTFAERLKARVRKQRRDQPWHHDDYPVPAVGSSERDKVLAPGSSDIEWIVRSALEQLQMRSSESKEHARHEQLRAVVARMGSEAFCHRGGAFPL